MNLRHGDYLVIGLQIFYLIIVGVYLYHGDWKKALYWFGAIVINTPVLFMER